MTLFGPATESCTYLLIIPILGWAMLEAAGETPRPCAWAWLAGSYALLLVAQAACWFPGGRNVQAMGLQPLAALALLIYLLIEPWRAARKSLEHVDAQGHRAMAA
jgi:hypothetical protein